MSQKKSVLEKLFGGKCNCGIEIIEEADKPKETRSVPERQEKSKACPSDMEGRRQ